MIKGLLNPMAVLALLAIGVESVAWMRHDAFGDYCGLPMFVAGSIGLLVGFFLIVIEWAASRLQGTLKNSLRSAPYWFLGVPRIHALFQGGWVSTQPWAKAAEAAALVAAIGFVYVALRGSGKGSASSMSRLAVVYGAALGILAVNETVLVGHYEPLHEGLLLGSVLCIHVGCRNAEPGSAANFRFAISAMVALSAACLAWMTLWGATARNSTLFLVDDGQVVAKVRALFPAPPAPTRRVAGTSLFATGRVSDEQLDRAFNDRREWNVLWVTIDTLRADHVGAYGYHRPTTPNLDALAREGHVFQRAITQNPASPLSFASMFTGMYPSALAPTWHDDGHLTLSSSRRVAEYLRDAGWRTFGVFALDPVQRAKVFPDLERGFGDFKTAKVGTQLEAEEVAEEVATWLGGRMPGKWFVWAHLFDPHAPYRPNPTIDFGTKPIDLYDAEIHSADAAFGRILKALRERGDFDRTLVVVHGDHGESFGERGATFHGSTLNEEQVHVPLVLRIPQSAAATHAGTVQIVDVAPTLTRLLGTTPSPPMHGRSLVRMIVPNSGLPPLPSAAYSERSFHDRVPTVHAAWFDRHKAIRNRKSGATRWYDLEADPGELNPLTSIDETTKQNIERLFAEVDDLGRDDAQVPEFPSDEKSAHDPDEIIVERMNQQLAEGRFDALRADLAIAIASAPSTNLLRRLLEVSYTAGALIDAPSLRDLRRHGDPDVRFATFFEEFEKHSTPPPEAWKHLLEDEDVRLKAIGHAMSARFGDHEAFERLKVIASSAPASNMRFMVACLALAGDGASLSIAGRPWDDPTASVVETLTWIAAFRSNRHFHALLDYMDESSRRAFPRLITAAVLRGISDLGKDCGVGIFRGPLSDPNPAIRSIAMHMIQQYGSIDELDDLRAVTDLALSAAGVSARSPRTGANETMRALSESVRRGVADPLLAIDLFRMMVKQKRTGEFAAFLAESLRNTDLPPLVARFFDRLRRISEGTLRAPDVHAELVDRPLVGPLANPWAFRLRIHNGPDGGVWIGGRETSGHAIRITTQSRDGTNFGSTFHMLPIESLLPGESIDMLVSVTPPKGLEGSWEVRVGLIDLESTTSVRDLLVLPEKHFKSR